MNWAKRTRDFLKSIPETRTITTPELYQLIDADTPDARGIVRKEYQYLSGRIHTSNRAGRDIGSVLMTDHMTQSEFTARGGVGSPGESVLLINPRPLEERKVFDPTVQSNGSAEALALHDDAVTGKPRTWTRAQILAVKPIKFNRSVERHAQQLKRDPRFDPRSAAYKIGFATVFIEETGEWRRLNGNTRCYLDEAGEVPLPDTVSGHEFRAKTVAEALSLYEKIDSPLSSKQAVDRMTTAFKYNGIAAHSKLFSRGGGTSALAVAHNAVHGRESNEAPKEMAITVGRWKNTLREVDHLLADCGVSSSGEVATHTAVIAAMLLSLEKLLYGIPKSAEREIRLNDWREFWGNFHASKGKLLGTGTSAYNAAWITVIENKSGKSQRKAVYSLTGKLLDCFERREQDRVLSIHSRKISEYFLPVKKK